MPDPEPTSDQIFPDPAFPDLLPLVDDMLAQNPILVEKVAKAASIPQKFAPELLHEVVRFLSLIGKHKTRLTPSHSVDMAWHELILCTQYYAAFCDRNFGRFIHHHPGGKDEETHQNFTKCLELYRNAFGTAPSRYWGQTQPITLESSCGNCLGENTH